MSAIFAYNADWKDGGSQLHGSVVQDRELSFAYSRQLRRGEQQLENMFLRGLLCRTHRTLPSFSTPTQGCRQCLGVLYFGSY